MAGARRTMSRRPARRQHKRPQGSAGEQGLSWPSMPSVISPRLRCELAAGVSSERRPAHPSSQRRDTCSVRRRRCGAECSMHPAAAFDADEAGAACSRSAAGPGPRFLCGVVAAECGACATRLEREALAAARKALNAPPRPAAQARKPLRRLPCPLAGQQQDAGTLSVRCDAARAHQGSGRRRHSRRSCVSGVARGAR